MSKTPHIVIIGAGLIGLSVADSLAARGAHVVVHDHKAGPGLGASFSNSGMIHLSQAAPWLAGDFYGEAKAALDLAKRSKALLRKRSAELGLNLLGRTPGCIQLFDSVYIGKQAALQYQSLGIACEDVTGTAHTCGRYALLFPDDMSGNAYAYCRALESDLRLRGVDFKYGMDSNEHSDLHEDHIVIAAGTGSREVAAAYGVDLPVSPLRGHALNFAKPSMILPDIPIMHHATRSAFTVFDDHVRLSGTVGEDEPEALIEIWEELMPELVLALGAPLSTWSEDRPFCELGRPVIAEVKPGLWINSGHAHMGWTLSAGSGDLIARMILEDHTDTRFRLTQ